MSEDRLGCQEALSILLEGCDRLRITLDDGQRDAVIRYCDALLEANRHVNLTGVRTSEGVMRTLFLDSLTVIGALRTQEPQYLERHLSVVDVGSGAGFPGLPLKIVCPQWTLTLIESVGKKARFLQETARLLGLEGVTVHNRRAEEAAGEPALRDRAELAVARAVAPLASLIELCAPFVRPGGLMAFPKSGPIESEMRSAASAVRRLKTSRANVVPVPSELGLGEGRFTILYRKTAPTPPGYPRRVGLAQSRPL